MATAHPDLDPLSIANTTERHLYLCLRDYLDEDWHLIHSLGYTDESGLRTQMGEADFVLLHPEHGLLVVEVKGGQPRIEAGTGEWCWDDGRRMKDPLFQVRMACKSIVDHLKGKLPEWRLDPPRYSHALAFPDARGVRGQLPPNWNSRAVLYAGDVERLEHWARLAARAYAPDAPAPGRDLVRRTIEVLLPQVTFEPGDRGRIAGADRVLVQLTDDQVFILDCLDENPRALVRGAAGTGKTVVAASRAARLAREGRRVLVLCYNNSLPPWIAQLCADRGAEVEVRTFHDLCMSLVEDATGRRPAVPGGKAAQEFWNAGLADLACDALKNTDRRYDAVFVDEAQDFAETWWVVVEGLLADPDAGGLYLFMDARQSLYERDMMLPECCCRLTLRRNCRNARPIAELVRDIGDADLRDLDRSPDGAAPRVIEVADPDAKHDAVRKVVHELVNEQGFDPARLVILGYHTLKRSSFGSRPRLGNLTVVDAAAEPAPNTIRYSTVTKFKGLESDVVLLTEVGVASDHLTDEKRRALLYVGASRARHLLYVFRHPGDTLLAGGHGDGTPATT